MVYCHKLACDVVFAKDADQCALVGSYSAVIDMQKCTHAILGKQVPFDFM